MFFRFFGSLFWCCCCLIYSAFLPRQMLDMHGRVCWFQVDSYVISPNFNMELININKGLFGTAGYYFLCGSIHQLFKWKEIFFFPFSIQWNENMHQKKNKTYYHLFNFLFFHIHCHITSLIRNWSKPKIARHWE